MKAIIIYQKTGGLHCSDGAVMETARRMVANRSPVTVSTGHIIDAIRVLIKTGEIDMDDVEFHFDGQVLVHNKDGRIENWPNGFNDTTLELLTQL